MLKPCILFIEDHKDFREAVRHFLELHDIQAYLIEAPTGEEGVFLATKKNPEIVVMDFYLGGMDGLEAARQIKKRVPKCNIIMLTMYDPKEIAGKDRKGTIKRFISKGDLYEQLVPVLRRILHDSDVNKKTT